MPVAKMYFQLLHVFGLMIAIRSDRFMWYFLFKCIFFFTLYNQTFTFTLYSLPLIFEDYWLSWSAKQNNRQVDDSALKVFKGHCSLKTEAGKLFH